MSVMHTATTKMTDIFTLTDQTLERGGPINPHNIDRSLCIFQMTAAATIPVLGETVDTLVPKPRPRVGSAPIPRLEITVAPDQVSRNTTAAYISWG